MFVIEKGCLFTFVYIFITISIHLCCNRTAASVIMYFGFVLFNEERDFGDIDTQNRYYIPLLTKKNQWSILY